MISRSVTQQARSGLPLCVERVDFSDLPRRTWDRLVRANPSATPFARWTFHRAWWDAYGSQASERYFVVSRPAAPGELMAIAPLMMRSDPGQPFDPRHPGTAPASGLGAASHPEPRDTLMMAASYHADYATLLAAPADMPDVVAALLRRLERPEDGDPHWDVVDLRRLRSNDPFHDALAASLGMWQVPAGWHVREEVEDVCPVVVLQPDWEAYLARLGKKARHEIRRKLRRAERSGPLELDYLPLSRESMAAFIELHQARWGSAGLFAADADGDRARTFFHRLAELESTEGEGASLHVGTVRAGVRQLYMFVGFAAEGRCYFYNAGMDPTALELSPGVVGTSLYLRDRIERGDAHFDFLRGNEDYKYQWGAVDEAVHRVVIEREPVV